MVEGKSMFSRTSLKGRETPSVKGRETPIILAAKNGITEMVEQILEIFPSDILDTDSVGKNIVLLAVEYRQTKLYQQLVRDVRAYESAFRAVDYNGNSPLHVAATLGDYRPYPFAALQMQREIKWFKVYSYFSSCFIGLIFGKSIHINTHSHL